jgi:hypothetical protein
VIWAGSNTASARRLSLKCTRVVLYDTVTLPYGSQVGPLVTAEGKKTEEVAATFALMTGKQPFVAEWRALKVPHVDLVSVVIDSSIILRVALRLRSSSA